MFEIKLSLLLICGLLPMAPLALAQCMTYGTGVNGAYNAPPGSSTIAAQVWNFTSFTIPAGDTVKVVGISSPMIIKCTGAVTINGVLTLAGQPGQTGILSTGGTAVGGAGGAGGGGGGQKGGQGGYGYPANSGGWASDGYTFASVLAGGQGGFNNDELTSGGNAEGGNGGSYGTYGHPGQENYDYAHYPQNPECNLRKCNFGPTRSSNTFQYSPVQLNDNTTNILGGSGGGGGGSHNSNSTAQEKSGCGGGGGGGGIKITALTISITGLLTVRGGDGGSEATGPPYIGGGGGGSGGAN